MATLKDLHDVSGLLKWRVTLFGATDKFQQRSNELLEAARGAVMEEQGISDPDKATALPEDTVLGEKAQAALEGLKALLSPK